MVHLTGRKAVTRRKTVLVSRAAVTTDIRLTSRFLQESPALVPTKRVRGGTMDDWYSSSGQSGGAAAFISEKSVAGRAGRMRG
jgi:hypothetical protein